MGKNVITKPQLRLRDDLYDQIVNGFTSTCGVYSTKAKYNNIQIDRIKNVGKIWGSSVQAFSYYENILNIISPKKKAITIERDAEIEDDEEDDEFEGEDEGGDDANSGLLKVLATVNSTYKWWKRINTAYRTIKIAKSVVDAYKSKTSIDQGEMKKQFTLLLIGTLGDALDGLMSPAIVKSQISILKMWKSPKVKNLFEALKQKKSEIEKYVSAKMAAAAIDKIPIIGGWVGNAVDAVHHGSATFERMASGDWDGATRSLKKASLNTALVAINFLDKTKASGKVGSKIAARTVKYAVYTKRAANAALWLDKGVDIAEIAYMLNNVIDYTQMDREEMRKWIDKEITNPLLKPAEESVQRSIREMGYAFEDGLQNKLMEFDAIAKDVVSNISAGNSLESQAEAKSEMLQDLQKSIIVKKVTSTDSMNNRTLRSSLGEISFDDTSWSTDETTKRMRSSFMNRYNIDIKGSIPIVETKESLSIKVMSAAISKISKWVGETILSLMTEVKKLISPNSSYLDSIISEQRISNERAFSVWAVDITRKNEEYRKSAWDEDKNVSTNENLKKEKDNFLKYYRIDESNADKSFRVKRGEWKEYRDIRERRVDRVVASLTLSEKINFIRRIEANIRLIDDDLSNHNEERLKVKKLFMLSQEYMTENYSEIQEIERNAITSGLVSAANWGATWWDTNLYGKIDTTERVHYTKSGYVTRKWVRNNNQYTYQPFFSANGAITSIQLGYDIERVFEVSNDTKGMTTYTQTTIQKPFSKGIHITEDIERPEYSVVFCSYSRKKADGTRPITTLYQIYNSFLDLIQDKTNSKSSLYSADEYEDNIEQQILDKFTILYKIYNGEGVTEA